MIIISLLRIARRSTFRPLLVITETCQIYCLALGDGDVVMLACQQARGTCGDGGCSPPNSTNARKDAESHFTEEVVKSANSNQNEGRFKKRRRFYHTYLPLGVPIG